MSILSVNNLCFAYKKDKPILQNICFDVEAGDMVLLCGKSGSGKTTLLNLLKKEIAPRGEFSGEILYEDTPLYSLAPAHSACDIGIVRQNVEGSIVCDTVAGELSFGLSSLGFPADVIKRRIAERDLRIVNRHPEKGCISLHRGFFLKITVFPTQRVEMPEFGFYGNLNHNQIHTSVHTEVLIPFRQPDIPFYHIDTTHNAKRSGNCQKKNTQIVLIGKPVRNCSAAFLLLIQTVSETANPI